MSPRRAAVRRRRGTPRPAPPLPGRRSPKWPPSDPCCCRCPLPCRPRPQAPRPPAGPGSAEWRRRCGSSPPRGRGHVYLCPGRGWRLETATRPPLQRGWRGGAGRLVCTIRPHSFPFRNWTKTRRLVAQPPLARRGGGGQAREVGTPSYELTRGGGVRLKRRGEGESTTARADLKFGGCSPNLLAGLHAGRAQGGRAPSSLKPRGGRVKIYRLILPPHSGLPGPKQHSRTSA